jgi:uncharacterized protein YvpB
MIINISKGKENFSQRNNLNKPLESCNVTSMCMAISYLGYEFPKGAYEQPEDNLRAFIEAHGKSPEVHADLSDMTNEWIGQKITSFSTERNILKIMQELLDGRPVVISGAFPGYPTLRAKPLHHIVCLVGAEWPDDKTEYFPESVIWDDPYGNTMNDWKGSGNDIKVPWQNFIDWIKPVGSAWEKWGHFFVAKEA